MMSVDFSDLAEPMYHFVSQPIIWEDFCQKSIQYDLSIAQYVCCFKVKAFIEWCSVHRPDLLRPLSG